MRKKISKSLFALSKNSRITTKALSKKIRSSQQSASYLIKQLKNKKFIHNYVTIVDPIKLGFSNIIVGFNYLSLDNNMKKEILDKLKNTNSIVSIQEASYGVDLIVEYCAPNLSAFNKFHSEIIHEFHKNLDTRFIFPIVVRHKHDKTYLINQSNNTDIVICGDRETNRLSESEKQVLQELIRNPDANFTAIAKSTKLSLKTVINIKKRLEKLRIIRGYGCILNHKALGIHRSLLLLKLSGRGVGEMSKLVEYSTLNKNIIELIKVIGDYQVLLLIENINDINIIHDLRSNFSIEDYWRIEIDNIYKESYLPMNLEE